MSEGRNGHEGYEGYGVRPDRTGQAEAFDAIGARYDQAYPHKEGQLAAGRWLIESLPAGSRILDVGCGTGLPTARQLTDTGHSVVGVDLSTGMLELAARNVPEAELLHRDVASLRAEGPGGLGRFDAITCFFTLLMLPRDEIPYALRQFHRLLEPGGLLALSMVEAELDDTEIPFLGHTVRVSGFLRDELRRVVCETGFEIAGESSYAYAPESNQASPSSRLPSTGGTPVSRGDPIPEHQLFLNCRRT